MAVFRRGAFARGPSRKPNRNQRFFSAVFMVFLEGGEWPIREELKQHFAWTGAIEFCKSWPRLNRRYVRIEDERVVLTVAALAQVDGAQMFLARYIEALHAAIERFQGKDKPLLSIEKLSEDMPGLPEAKARCLLQLLESEGLLTRQEPDAPSYLVNARVTQFTGAEDRVGYLRVERRLERGRYGKRLRAYLRRLWSSLFGPDSSLWARLAGGVAVILAGFALGLPGGLFAADEPKQQPARHAGPNGPRR